MMLKKLKRVFVVLSTALTGLVLLAACVLAFSLAKTQIESTSRETFEYQSQTLSVLLAGTNQLDHDQIYRMEKDGDVRIFLFDNGNPIKIMGGEEDPLREVLYDAALTALESDNLSVSVTPNARNVEPVNVSTGFSYEGTDYLAKYISTPKGVRQWYSIVLIKPTVEQQTRISQMAALYAGIFIGGLALLFFISWALAKRSVKPVEDAQAKQKEFIAAASHELKSPLAVITSSVDVMENTDSDAAKCRQNIKSEAKRMSSLIEDMLILAGSETGKWTLKKAPANIEDLLAGVFELYLPIAKKKELLLTLTLPDENLPIMLLDEERILQVLSIILSNAISYSPSGSEVIVSAKTGRKHIYLVVQDNGAGVPDGDKERIFDSFYRAQRGHSDKSHYGLGLAVARELVMLHDGKIAVSDTPGGGATFTVSLPLKNEGE